MVASFAIMLAIRLARGDTSFTNKLLYFGGTAQYSELCAFVEFMKGMAGSCAEFSFPPLRRLLEQYILQSTGKDVNLVEDSNALVQSCSREYSCSGKLP